MTDLALAIAYCEKMDSLFIETSEKGEDTGKFELDVLFGDNVPADCPVLVAEMAAMFTAEVGAGLLACANNVEDWKYLAWRLKKYESPEYLESLQNWELGF